MAGDATASGNTTAWGNAAPWGKSAPFTPLQSASGPGSTSQSSRMLEAIHREKLLAARAWHAGSIRPVWSPLSRPSGGYYSHNAQVGTSTLLALFARNDGCTHVIDARDGVEAATYFNSSGARQMRIRCIPIASSESATCVGFLATTAIGASDPGDTAGGSTAESSAGSAGRGASWGTSNPLAPVNVLHTRASRRGPRRSLLSR